MKKSEYELLAAFRYALRRFLRFSEEGAASVGLTPKQYQAMLAIRGFPGRDSILIGELAERLQIRHHSAVGLADRLASQDLVARGQSPDDKRQVFLSLTERGEKVLEQLASMHRAELRRVGPEINQLLERIARVDE